MLDVLVGVYNGCGFVGMALGNVQQTDLMHIQGLEITWTFHYTILNIAHYF